MIIGLGGWVKETVCLCRSFLLVFNVFLYVRHLTVKGFLSRWASMVKKDHLRFKKSCPFTFFISIIVYFSFFQSFIFLLCKNETVNVYLFNMFQRPIIFKYLFYLSSIVAFLRAQSDHFSQNLNSYTNIQNLLSHITKFELRILEKAS